MAEKLLKLLIEAQEVKQGAPSDEVDQQIDVAVLTFLPAGDRAEQPHPSAVVPGGDRLDVVAVALDPRLSSWLKTTAAAHAGAAVGR